MQTYLVKCIWNATAFVLKVLAVSETDALAKAARNKNARTALAYKVIGVR